MYLENEKKYMRRCFQLSKLGLGKVAPNPMVGCVIVHNDKIIGEGFHRQFGEPHAEINALNSVANKSLLKDSVLYVNLEPCSHYGKTPPCALRLINEGIKNVVVCNLDPNPKVAGRGVTMLRDAGIEVSVGLLEQEGWILNRRFFTYHTKHRPYIILKWAQTADGYIDGIEEKPLLISSNITKALVHQMRAEEMAILVGTKTALKDNPKLHTRRWFGKNPLRIAVDRNLSIPNYYNLYDGSVSTIIYNSVKNDNDCLVKLDFKSDIITQILADLYERGIQSLIVEGGKFTLDCFIKSKFYDEVQIEESPVKCGSGVAAPIIKIPEDADIKMYGNHRIVIFKSK